MGQGCPARLELEHRGRIGKQAKVWRLSRLCREGVARLSRQRHSTGRQPCRARRVPPLLPPRSLQFLVLPQHRLAQLLPPLPPPLHLCCRLGSSLRLLPRLPAGHPALAHSLLQNTSQGGSRVRQRGAPRGRQQLGALGGQQAGVGCAPGGPCLQLLVQAGLDVGSPLRRDELGCQGCQRAARGQHAQREAAGGGVCRVSRQLSTHLPLILHHPPQLCGALSCRRSRRRCRVQALGGAADAAATLLGACGGCHGAAQAVQALDWCSDGARRWARPARGTGERMVWSLLVLPVDRSGGQWAGLQGWLCQASSMHVRMTARLMNAHLRQVAGSPPGLQHSLADPAGGLHGAQRRQLPRMLCRQLLCIADAAGGERSDSALLTRRLQAPAATAPVEGGQAMQGGRVLSKRRSKLPQLAAADHPVLARSGCRRRGLRSALHRRWRGSEQMLQPAAWVGWQPRVAAAAAVTGRRGGGHPDRCSPHQFQHPLHVLLRPQLAHPLQQGGCGLHEAGAVQV